MIMENFKNLFLLLLGISIAHVHVQAQFSLGIKGGYTVAWEYYGEILLPDDAEIDVRGFNISALAYYQLNRFLRVGIEPGYVQRGAACVPGSFPVFRGDTKFYLDYAELPIMASFHLPILKNKFEISAKTGYGAAFLIKAIREQALFGPDEPPIREKMELGENSILNRWDHGFYGGIGIARNLGTHQIFLESDFYLGLVDAERFNTSKNRSIDLNIGYRILL